MTNKSIGSFLAELRKEKGLTQKEVADFLNVSDKTVSHWECDKYSPDISMIPIIAEFFGVTCDEILKGEKKALEHSDDTASTIAEETENTAGSDCHEIAEENYTEPTYNRNNFSFKPLTKDREYAKYARIRLHNAFSKMKLTNIIAVFTAIAMWAVSYTVIQLIEHHIGLHNFELYATIGTAFFSAAVGAIIILSSHLKFISMLNMCPFEEVEFIKWRRMARSILVVPMAIFVLICIIAVMVFMPLAEPPVETATETVPYHEEDMPHSVEPSVDYEEGDPSVPITGEIVVSSD